MEYNNQYDDTIHSYLLYTLLLLGYEESWYLFPAVTVWEAWHTQTGCKSITGPQRHKQDKHKHSFSPTLSDNWRIINSPNVHVFDLWVETRVPAETYTGMYCFMIVKKVSNYYRFASLGYCQYCGSKLIPFESHPYLLRVLHCVILLILSVLRNTILYLPTSSLGSFFSASGICNQKKGEKKGREKTETCGIFRSNLD